MEPADGVVTKRQLFFGFLQIGLSGFGGVMPWARRVVVEQRQWLTEEEFTEVLGLGQILPGPNVLNAAIGIGERFQGSSGALLCMAGLLLAPFLILLMLALLFDRYGQIPAVRHACVAVSFAAAGLIMATGLKMAAKVKGRRRLFAFSVLTFIPIALLQWPLLWVLLVLAPLSVGVARRQQHG